LVMNFVHILCSEHYRLQRSCCLLLHPFSLGPVDELGSSGIHSVLVLCYWNP
jgi:hypothetical protein